MNDSDPGPLFEAAAVALSAIGVAFLEVREPGPEGTNGRAERPPIAPRMRAAFAGLFVLNSDYDGAKGQAAVDAGEADAIAFGRPFIANPDLPARIARGAPSPRTTSTPGTRVVPAATSTIRPWPPPEGRRARRWRNLGARRALSRGENRRR